MKETGSPKASNLHDKYALPKKSILKETPSPDIKKRHGRTLAWQDFHGKELSSVMEFVARYGLHPSRV